MNKQEFLESIRKQIHFVFDRDAIEEELKAHIEESAYDYISEGYSKEEAEQKAVEQMGNPIEIGKMLNEQHHPLLGYLWMTSKVILGLLVIPAIIMIGYFGYDVVRLATPTTLDYGKQKVRLDIEFDIDTHDVTIDYLYNIGPNQYSITYRAWRNLRYSRTGWSSYMFDIQGEDGDFLVSSGYNSNGVLGSIGCKDFSYPENGVIRIVTRTGEVFTVDLKEYVDEKK